MDKIITLPRLQQYDQLMKQYISDTVSNIEDLLSYGVEWDTTVSDPACTRIGNPLLHKSLPIQSQYRGCIWNPTEKKIAYYLDPNDWSKKEDGTASVLDGTDGTVRVHIPKYYVKCGTNGTKQWVRESTIKIDDTWTEIPEMVVDAYCATLDRTDSSNLKLVSVVNTTANFRGGNNDSSYDQYLGTDNCRTQLGKSASNISRTSARTYARNAGSELLSYNQYKWTFYWNWVIEYATRNSQAAFNSQLTSDGYHQGGMGSGVTVINWNYWTYYNGNRQLTPCGYCNEFGNGTGIKQMTLTTPTAEDGTGSQQYTFNVFRWRGFDNVFGDIWKQLDGVLVDTPLAGADDTSVTPTCYIINDAEDYTDSLTDIATKADYSFQLPHSKGYVASIIFGEHADVLPLTMGGGSTQHFCDYYYVDYGTTYNTALVGGAAHHGSNAGLGCFVCGQGVSGASSHAGFYTVNVL